MSSPDAEADLHNIPRLTVSNTHLLLLPPEVPKPEWPSIAELPPPAFLDFLG